MIGSNDTSYAEQTPTPDLEAEAMRAMGVDVVEVPRDEYDRLMAAATAEEFEIAIALSEQREREASLVG
jgi:hypothetical protein